MAIIDEELLEKRYRQLMAVTIRKSTLYASTEIAFDKGFWRDEEWYKHEVWEKAQQVLDVSSWKREQTDLIIDRVKKVLWLTMADGKVQNLVSESNATEAVLCIDTHKKQAAGFLYDLYADDLATEHTFTALVKIFAKTYDPFSVVAYLFFIKDRNNFIPVRKKTYSEICFQKLGIPPRLVLKCTWENYNEIIDSVRKIQSFLQERFANVELIDAQSFLWMMHLVDNNGEEYNPDDIEENESKVTVYLGLKEGRKTEYFVKRYERKAENRRVAINIHGCRCMACGFDFEKAYGETGKNFIEVHHLKPLSSLDEEVAVNPETDLVCLCANCHRMVHRGKNHVLSLEELVSILNKQKEKYL